MLKYVNTVTNAPAAVGPYSQAVWAGDFFFVSGQIAIDPGSGKIITNDIAGQATQVLVNLNAILNDQELSIANVVKTTIFMVDLSHFQTVNQLYADFFGDNRPARATVQVAALPLGALIEMDLVAYRKE